MNGMTVEELIRFCQFRERVATALSEKSGLRFGECYTAVKRMKESHVYSLAAKLQPQAR